MALTPQTAVPELPDARIDKWLWAVRIYKTRALATAACRSGMVHIGDLAVKPGRDVHAGETVHVRQGVMERRLQVIASPRSRVGAKDVSKFCLDQTPETEWAKARELKVQHFLAREKGSGRPTKKERRALDTFLGPRG